MSARRASRSARFVSVARHTWDLGFTAFGGPPVHFQILHKRFVQQQKWIDEQTYTELFSVCQALPGPASTKMLYCIALYHGGFLPALLALAFWSLPGALGMFGLALGVARIQEVLPSPVYALLSGLNAATVGLIALAGMQLSKRTITDLFSRTILIGAASAGLCYSSLWYYPTLMAIAGALAVAWDFYVRKAIARARDNFERFLNNRRRQTRSRDIPQEEAPVTELPQMNSVPASRVQTRSNDESSVTPSTRAQEGYHVSIRTGYIIVAVFLAVFITVIVLRSVLQSPPVELRLFSNLFLAGTIIFGGGPVVIPLLREYIVTEGWVTSRDFLIGLAMIQAFPGPNFNFAVFLAALAAPSTNSPAAITALLGFIGIFTPGISLATGFQAFWSKLRKYQTITSLLRGINAAAVGLIWTAVYRLWEAGYLIPGQTTGSSLSKDPWWLVVAAIAFCGNEWYNIPAPVSIISGGVLGIGKWLVTGMR